MQSPPFWSQFLIKENSFYDLPKRKYLKKGYLHFDYRIWFPEFQIFFEKFCSSSSNIASHSFLPFLKFIAETKRIRFDKEKGRRVKNIKPRPICYAAHFDALVYSYYSTILSELYEQYLRKHSFSHSVLAYRSLEKNNIDFAYEVFQHIPKIKDCVAIALDVKSFFDTLDHSILKRNWIHLLNDASGKNEALLHLDHFRVFESITKFSYVNKDDLYKVLNLTDKRVRRDNLKRFCSIEDFRNVVRGGKNKSIIKRNNSGIGIPQGSGMSAILSNIYMIEYDKILTEFAASNNCIYRRYSDDIIFLCPKDLLTSSLEKLYLEIEKLGLTIQAEKEEVIEFRKDEKGNLRGYKTANYRNLQYLGFEFNGKNVYIRSSSLSRYHRRVRSRVRETIKQAYGSKSHGGKIFVKRLYNRYTHLGDNNFISYAHRAANKMGSMQIRKQLANHVSDLKEILNEKKKKHEKYLVRKGRFTKTMEL